MMTYQIEVMGHDGWSDDASLLGLGVNQDDNSWSTLRDAENALKALVSVGFRPDSLRVRKL
jgi:hypothetical protein